MSNPKKRKAEAIAAASDGSTCIPYLPAHVLGLVLDFMPYTEVRSALLAGKTMAIDAARSVRTLNILKSSELDIVAVRRFSSVTDVNVLSFLPFVTDDEGKPVMSGTSNRFTASFDTAVRVIPFLTHIPALEKAFIGGGWGCRHGESLKIEYDANGGELDRHGRPNVCAGPQNHRELFRGLFYAALGAYKSKTLSRKVSLRGVTDNYSCASSCMTLTPSEHGPCRLCVDVCSNLPFGDLFNCLSSTNWRLLSCMTPLKKCQIVRERHDGGMRFLQHNTGRILCEWINQHSKTYKPRRDLEEDEWRNFQQLLERDQLDPESWVMHVAKRHYKANEFGELDGLIEFGLKPSDIPREEVRNELHLGPYVRYPGWNRPDIWFKSTFDGLKDRGFDLDPKDFILVDEMLRKVST